VPAGATVQDAAATLLAFFAALPRPFMPPAALQVARGACLTGAAAGQGFAAAALVGRAMGKHEPLKALNASRCPAVCRLFVWRNRYRLVSLILT